MKKLLLILGVLCICIFPTFAEPLIIDSAYDSVVSLSSIKTEHFEFIYPQSLEKEALHLYQHAENTYNDLIEYFGAPWNAGRLSVVLTADKSASLNAYYTPYTSSHVVLYVTSPDEGSLSSFKDTLLSTFEHEVVHAYTLKIHDTAMQGASVFFGDYFSNGMFLPNFIIEGLAVAFESRGTDGRLNNPFVTSRLRQALHEQKFPEWRYLMGWNETDPIPEFEYIAGGAFIDFLRHEYGTKKFYKFIAGFGNMFSFPYLFTRIYDMDVSDAWRAFIASLPYPGDIVYPKKALGGSGEYKSLKFADSNFYFSDTSTKEIYRYGARGIDKIADIGGVFDSLAVSYDGRYYAYSTKYNSNDVAHIYERESGCILTLENIRHIAFSSFRSEAIIVGERVNGAYNDIVAYSLKGELLYSYPLSYGVEALSFASFDDSTFAFLFRDGNEIRLAVHNMTNSKNDVYSFPGKLVSNLSSVKINESNIIITMSYVNKASVRNSNTYPNVLILNFNKGGMLLSSAEGKKEIDGGVWSPIVCEDSLYFISRKFTSDSLSLMHIDDMELTESTVVNVGYLKTREVDTSIKNYIGTVQDYYVMKLAEPRHYSRFINSVPFVRKGALIPLSYDRKDSALKLEAGLSFISADPTESMQSNISISYNPRPYVRGGVNKWFETNRLSFELGWEFDVLPVKLYFGIRPLLYFDKTTGMSFFTDFFMTSDYKYKFKTSNSYIKASLTFGWIHRFIGTLDIVNKGFYGSFDAHYSSVKSRGYGFKEYAGWLIGANLNLKETTYTNPFFLSTNAYANFYVPHIIPVKNLPTATFNLPLRLSFVVGYNMNGEKEYTNKPSEAYSHLLGAGVKVKFVLFSFAVDKIISDYFPFAINRFTFEVESSALYNWVIDSANKHHLLNVGLGVEGYFTISAAFLSAALSSPKVDLGVRYDMDWLSDSNIDNFAMRGTSPWGKISLIARLNLVV